MAHFQMKYLLISHTVLILIANLVYHWHSYRRSSYLERSSAFSRAVIHINASSALSCTCSSSRHVYPKQRTMLQPSQWQPEGTPSMSNSFPKRTSSCSARHASRRPGVPLFNIDAGYIRRPQTISVEGHFEKAQPLFDLTTRAYLLLHLNGHLRFDSPTLFSCRVALFTVSIVACFTPRGQTIIVGGAFAKVQPFFDCTALGAVLCLPLTEDRRSLCSTNPHFLTFAAFACYSKTIQGFWIHPICACWLEFIANVTLLGSVHWRVSSPLAIIHANAAPAPAIRPILSCCIPWEVPAQEGGHKGAI
jgi:hypothetical protein